MIEDTDCTPVRDTEAEADGPSEQDRREAACTAEICKQLRLTLFEGRSRTRSSRFSSRGIDLSDPAARNHLWRRVRTRNSRIGAARLGVLQERLQSTREEPAGEHGCPHRVGSSTAYLYSVAVLLGLVAGGLYFDTAALILMFITLGNTLRPARRGKLARRSARSSKWVPTPPLSSTKTVPNARCPSRRSRSATDESPPGEKIPTDSVVVERQSAVDESMIRVTRYSRKERQRRGRRRHHR